MVTVTRANFLEQSNDLIRHLPTAAFVALDEELTGITLPNNNCNTNAAAGTTSSSSSSSSSKLAKDETAQQRYQTNLKPVAERYSIVQLGICLFHQHPEYDPSNPSGPEFTVRRYNFFLFPSAETNQHGKTIPHASTREVVLNPSSIAFLIQHNMDLTTWMQSGIPFALESQAPDYIQSYVSTRKREQHQQSHAGAAVPPSPPVMGGHNNVAVAVPTSTATTSGGGGGGSRIELHRTEDINFFARTMASLREWLDAAHAPSRRLHGDGAGMGDVDDDDDDDEDDNNNNNNDDGGGEDNGTEHAVADPIINNNINNNVAMEPSLSDGTSFLLPPCNSFLRRALYENIRLEYPALVLELAGPSYPNQIRVWRLNDEERLQRQERLQREAWETLVVDKLGMWRIFHALSNANRGIREEHSIALALSWTEVVERLTDTSSSPTTTTTTTTTSGHYQVPIVVHNGLMDILFLMTHFVQWQLPASYLDLKQLIHSHFPVLYDTKLISTECCCLNTWNFPAAAAPAAAPANNNAEGGGNVANAPVAAAAAAAAAANVPGTISNPASPASTVLANLYNKVIVRSELDHKFRFVSTTESSLPQAAEANSEQLHQASYDAYMTGAVFVVLCQSIMQEREFAYQPPPQQQQPQQQVASLNFLLSPPPSGVTNPPTALDHQIKWLFGRNKLYSMMAMFTIDLECSGRADPLRRGMTTTSTFRISGVDPSVATRDVLLCLSHVTDRQDQKVNFEIVWVDDTTFLVAASYLPKTLAPPDGSVVQEHGQVLFGRLRRRFAKETIVTLEDYWNEQEEERPSATTTATTKTSSWLGWLWNATFGGGNGGTSNTKRKHESGSIGPATSKRARVD